jgi:hypothetical protein
LCCERTGTTLTVVLSTSGVCVLGSDPGEQLAQAVTSAGAVLVPPSEAAALIWGGGAVTSLRQALAAASRARWVQLPSAGSRTTRRC